MRKITVLVVEDQALLRWHAVDMIENAGFIALEAEDADAAIAILMLSADIQLVFTDIEMPGSMDGIQLAALVRDRWPPMHIIVTSGRSAVDASRSEEHTSELQSLMRISYAVFCLKKKIQPTKLISEN